MVIILSKSYAVYAKVGLILFMRMWNNMSTARNLYLTFSHSPIVIVQMQLETRNFVWS
jgi:hypothetical protein